jgi:probable HAF family extracellular repeat protein
MLRDRLADIIFGAVFLFIALAACSIAAIRRRSGVRLFNVASATRRARPVSNQEAAMFTSCRVAFVLLLFQGLWDDGKQIDLNTQTTGGNPITANAINDAGEIVGGGAFSSRVFDAYVWRDGAATDVGTLSGDCFSEAIAINSGRQVVGNSVSCDGSKQRAFLWRNGSIVDLNTLIPPNSNLQLVATLAINDGGEEGSHVSFRLGESWPD